MGTKRVLRLLVSVDLLMLVIALPTIILLDPMIPSDARECLDKAATLKGAFGHAMTRVTPVWILAHFLACVGLLVLWRPARILYTITTAFGLVSGFATMWYAAMPGFVFGADRTQMLVEGAVLGVLYFGGSGSPFQNPSR